ncbi:MAG: tRNA (adenosine(37)-N6)-threonylcarbamoyltransferase complex dimerization subunit type 1 TsaB [Planctomycetota bacterium]|nr:tRNA (adenosine(37)-N6)-threonylcarbamoyltransferase complex dimerization subunit type 1 TsaB [Planctomycetota bacterium]
MTATAREGQAGAHRLIVALETSTRPASIAVQGPDGARAALSLEEDRRHASDLLGALSELVARVGATPADLGLVIAGVGPGSYTGLRVGASTALGFMRGAGAEVLGVPSFAAIAADGLAVGERGVVLRNAFGGHLYLAAYERLEGDVVPRVAPACVGADQAVAVIRDHPILMADEAALKVLGELPANAAELRGDARARAEVLLDLGLARLRAGADVGPETLRPLYLRPFDAKVRRR